MEEELGEIPSEISADIPDYKAIEDHKKAKEILSDEKFILQKGLCSLVDKDARVGYKSKNDSFYGYKIEFTMIPQERIITALEVSDVAYVDGNKFKEDRSTVILFIGVLLFDFAYGRLWIQKPPTSS